MNLLVSHASSDGPVALDPAFAAFLRARIEEERTAAEARASADGESSAGDAGEALLQDLANDLEAGRSPDPMSLRLLVLAFDRHPDFRREWSPWSR